MRENIFFFVIFLLTATFILVPNNTEAKCNLCSKFGVACINETAFHMCSRGQPQTDKVFICPSNRVCTDTSSRCADATTSVVPACELNKGCGICSEDKIFACTSRTTFAQCDGNKLTKKTDVCPDDLVCDSQQGDICKTECQRPAVIECDRDTPL